MRLAVITMLGLMVSAIAGCGTPNTLGTVPITGIVTLDGTPVEGASVVFAPTGSEGLGASGVTGADGRYSLTTQQPQDGAMPGKYAVFVSKTETAKSASDLAVKPGMTAEEATQAAMEARDAAGKPEAKSKELLPVKYKTPAGGFTADVSKEGKKEFNWELTSK